VDGPRFTRIFSRIDGTRDPAGAVGGKIILFTFLAKPAAESIIEGVPKLEPGQLLIASPHTGVHVERYWNPVFEPDRSRSEAYFVFSLEGSERYLDAITLFRRDARQRMFRADVCERLAGYDPSREVLYHLTHVKGHWLSALQYLDLKSYLPLDILPKVDQMSMAHSIEARVPLLDHALIEFAATIPQELQMRGGVKQRAARGFSSTPTTRWSIPGLVAQIIIQHTKTLSPLVVVVPSEYLRQVFAGHGYQVRVIQNVVDALHFSYHERDPLGPHLLSSRNLEPHYGVDVILRAFALIKKAFPDGTLTIAGWGSQEAALRELAASLGVDGVSFVGRQAPPAVAALYDRAHIFVNASTIDNQPVSVLEAFASGLPIVTTPTGDIGNMVSARHTGLLVPPDNPPALAAAVTELLKYPARARWMARCARRQVERYTWRVVRESWARVYAQGIGR
jgi:glycosyltransferase involved in cell wall biosynthesis